jgi:hypothetical protein
MAARIVSVAEYVNAAEAALAQGLLEEEGIAAELSGVQTQAFALGETLWTNAVRLEVRLEDAERAVRILRAKDEHIRARVHREIDEERGEGPPPEPPQDSPVPDSEPGLWEGVAEEGEETQDDDDEEPDDALPESSPADRIARRLFIGTVLGTCFGLLMWVTVVLWIARPPPEDGLSERGRRHRTIATVLVVLWVVRMVCLLILLRKAWAMMI